MRREYLKATYISCGRRDPVLRAANFTEECFAEWRNGPAYKNAMKAHEKMLTWAEKYGKLRKVKLEDE